MTKASKEILKDRRDYRGALIHRINTIAARSYAPGTIPAVDAHYVSLKSKLHNVEQAIGRLRA